MRNLRIFSSIACLWLSFSLSGQAQDDIRIEATARAQAPGELVALTITPPSTTDTVEVRAFGRDIPTTRLDQQTWQALVGIDLDVAPGTHRVQITARSSGSETSSSHPLAIKAKSFPTRTLTVDPVYVEPPPETTARIQREAALQQRLWDNPTPVRLWSGAFVAPVTHRANSAFGSRSVFNGVPRSPHSGADFSSPAGTPIKAPNGGQVVLARELYFSGNAVVIDHGQGLLSVFAHLSSFAVEEGAHVSTGQTVGLVGSTGRVTGPHLHWTVRANGARVDPLSLLDVLGAVLGR